MADLPALPRWRQATITTTMFYAEHVSKSFGALDRYDGAASAALPPAIRRRPRLPSGRNLPRSANSRVW